MSSVGFDLVLICVYEDGVENVCIMFSGCFLLFFRVDWVY